MIMPVFKGIGENCVNLLYTKNKRIMNSIYRNFIITLKVNKMAATLNICGLVIAFTLFDSVAIRTESERTFDKIHSKAEAIYRLDCVTSKSQWPTQILPFVPSVRLVFSTYIGSTIINPYVGEVYLRSGGTRSQRL